MGFWELAGSGAEVIAPKGICREWLLAEAEQASALASATDCKYWAKSLHPSLFWLQFVSRFAVIHLGGFELEVEG